MEYDGEVLPFAVSIKNYKKSHSSCRKGAEEHKLALQSTKIQTIYSISTITYHVQYVRTTFILHF